MVKVRERRCHSMEKQDPVDVAPDVYEVPLENERVRVLDIRLQPGREVPQHSHPAHVIYVVDDCKVKFSYPDGESEELELKAGQTLWSDGVTHTPENTGTSELHALNFELKE
jgi:beta-alanine degradation protein BauB